MYNPEAKRRGHMLKCYKNPCIHTGWLLKVSINWYRWRLKLPEFHAPGGLHSCMKLTASGKFCHADFMVLSFARSDGPPCDLLKIHTCKAYILWQQPLWECSLPLGLGQGVVDEWSIEKHLSGHPPGTVHGRRCWRGLSLMFKAFS